MRRPATSVMSPSAAMTRGVVELTRPASAFVQQVAGEADQRGRVLVQAADRPVAALAQAASHRLVLLVPVIDVQPVQAEIVNLGGLPHPSPAYNVYSSLISSRVVL